MSTFGVAIWLLISSYVTFLSAPTATGRSVYRIPISTVPFPVVALCSGTRISREALTNYAEYIYSKQNETKAKIANTYRGVFEHILQLGSTYTLNTEQDNFYLFDRLHTFFTEIYGNPYNLNEILGNLTPTCDDFLKQCFWNGEAVKCSDIFNTNWTDYGRCCAFNYKRLNAQRMDEFAKQGLDIPKPKPLYVKASKFGSGLSVIIEQNTTDLNYNIYSSMASRVLIIKTEDYPDKTTNAYNERLIHLSGEVFVDVFPESIKGSDTMRHVSANSRGCFFPDEKLLVFKGFYTFSECQLTCKTKDVIRFCGCYPHQYATIYSNASRCMLQDISCLIRWKSRWDNSDPYILNARSKVLGAMCPECKPRCSYMRYGIRSNFGMLHPYTPLDIINHSNESHLSMVHVRFAQPYGIEYTQTIVSTWYDLLATLGGVAGFIIGASLLSVVEFAWFASGKLGTVWFEKGPDEKEKDLPPIYLTDFKITKKKFGINNEKILQAQEI